MYCGLPSDSDLAAAMAHDELHDYAVYSTKPSPKELRSLASTDDYN